MNAPHPTGKSNASKDYPCKPGAQQDTASASQKGSFKGGTMESEKGTCDHK